ncbi:hypothetical protein MGN70_003062 [Eutypa lata]|uniref:Putative fad binding domain containing protein n=1 Tax=Eutypa lata (strain UCR-EL1) TaxID=1287681 RepID=M7TIM8_EUTLA|nr:putative fad binding domain containing protein [Eutypa lata UCREL1]KAI1254999.1 hypothetical protein MGN70_003062 [Eutypa lata]
MPSAYPEQASCLIAAGLQGQLLLPQDPDYKARIESYWSNSSKLKPACILQPTSATEVSSAVSALAAAGQKFAVRSGGCNFWPSNNIDGGVTIDLGRMDSVVYQPEGETVSMGPGARWGQVYERLAKYERAVAGGREATVGVAGLILGGGNTLFTARYGFACDQVVEFEVVLADGRIVTANASSEYHDLYLALKGGANNFGIVTRFIVNAIPCGDLWGGGVLLPRNIFPAAADAIVDFTDNVTSDPDSNLICMVAHLQPNQPTVIAALYANIAGKEKPPIFDKWLAFPEMFKSYKRTTMTELMVTTEQATGYHGIWYTMSFKNDASIISKAAELHDGLVAKMQERISDGDFKTQCIFQPLPRSFAQRSIESGGNVLGIENHSHDGILWGAHVMVRTPELEVWASPHVRLFYEGVRDFAASRDGLLSWVTANYANPSQDVLQSYGKVNVERIRRAAAKYDPHGVFQTLCPGGFKISAVKG